MRRVNNANYEPAGAANGARRWQFSTRNLLVITAIVSAVLAVAVRLPFFFAICLWIAAPTLLLIAVLQSANFATSDHRPRLALLAWIALGSFFALFAFAILLWMLNGREMISGFAVFGFAVMTVCCGTCLFRAVRCGCLIASSRTGGDSSAVAMPETPVQTETGRAR